MGSTFLLKYKRLVSEVHHFHYCFFFSTFATYVNLPTNCGVQVVGTEFLRCYFFQANNSMGSMHHLPSRLGIGLWIDLCMVFKFWIAFAQDEKMWCLCQPCIFIDITHLALSELSLCPSVSCSLNMHDIMLVLPLLVAEESPRFMSVA